MHMMENIAFINISQERQNIVDKLLFSFMMIFLICLLLW